MAKLFLFCSFIVAVSCNVIPENVYNDPCSTSDPNLNKCILNKLESVKKFIPTGVPELNVPVLDPFTLEEVDVDHKITDTAWIKAKLKGLVAKGGSSVIFEDIKFDPSDLTGEIKLILPHINAETEYNLKGQFLVAPFENRGYFRGNFSDVRVTARGSFKKVNRNGVELIQIDKAEFVATVGDSFIKLTSKSPETQFLADFAANFFNESPTKVLETISPFYIRTVTTYAKLIINNVLSIIPYNELLKE